MVAGWANPLMYKRVCQKVFFVCKTIRAHVQQRNSASRNAAQTHRPGIRSMCTHDLDLPSLSPPQPASPLLTPLPQLLPTTRPTHICAVAAATAAMAAYHVTIIHYGCLRHTCQLLRALAWAWLLACVCSAAWAHAEGQRNMVAVETVGQGRCLQTPVIAQPGCGQGCGTGCGSRPEPATAIDPCHHPPLPPRHCSDHEELDPT